MENFTEGQPVYRVTVANKVNGHRIARKVVATEDEARGFLAETTEKWGAAYGLALPGHMVASGRGLFGSYTGELSFREAEDYSRAPIMV